MGAALALAIGTAIPLSLAFAHRVAGPVVATPGRVTVSIGAGNYVLQEHTESGAHVLLPSRVTVTGPGGSTVPVDTVQGDDTVDVGPVEYRATIGFATPRTGTYTIDVTGPEARVVVARASDDVLRANLVWVITLVVALVGFVVGVVLLLVGLLARAAAGRRAAPQPTPPNSSAETFTPTVALGWAPPEA